MRANATLRVVVACALVTIPIGGCSVVYDLNGYASGAAPIAGSQDADVDSSPQPPSDADARDVTGSDAARDASSDVSTDAPSDAPTDAPTDTTPNDSAPLGFCASRSPAPLFCDDFDTRPLAVVWDRVGTAGTTPVHDTSVSVSPLASLLVAVPPLSSGQALDAVVDKDFASLQGKPYHGDLAFQLRIDALDMQAHVGQIAALQNIKTSGSSAWVLQLVARYNGGRIDLILAEYEYGIDGGDLYQETTATAAINAGQWHAVRISVALPYVGVTPPNGANTASLYVDGAMIAKLSFKFPVLPYVPELELGSSYIAEPTQAWVLRYDDAWIDLTSP